MNIEEKNSGARHPPPASRLFHFHACENDRGTPGSGHVPWHEIFDALSRDRLSRVDRRRVVPAPVTEIARAVSLWRPVAPSMDALAREGLGFLRKELSS